MAGSGGRAFLLPAGLPEATVQQVALLVLTAADLGAQQVTFAEGGSDVDVELSVPFRAGMDEVVVDAAQLTLAADQTPLAITGWHAVAGPGGQGVFVVLDTPARLRRLVLDPANQPAGTFVVVRAATLDSGGPPTAGPPLFAGGGFDTGPMLPRALAGMSVTGSDGRLVVTVPLAQGQAWLVQFGTGDTAAALAPQAGQPQVTEVTVAPAPSDISLVLRGRSAGEADTALWQHPGALLPESGQQLADFTPAAGRRLAQVLADTSAGTPTLALPLRFSAKTAGTLLVLDQVLTARYVAHPAAAAPTPLTLDGGWVDLPLDAPARRPSATTLALRARHLGREVNPGSPAPPMALPLGGVRVRPGRLVAAPVPWQPAPAVGGTPSLAMVRLLAAPVGDTELVAEVHADAAGAPGALLAGPLVARLAAGAAPGWVGLALAATADIPAPATLWVSVRTNRGALDWFAADTGPTARASADGGTSWGELEAGLGPVGTPWVQLQHAVDPATAAAPALTVRLGGTLLGTVGLTGTGQPGEYGGPTPAVLPAAVLDALAAPAAPDTPVRRRTTLSLLCPAVLTLTVPDLTCSYDPFG